MLINFIICVFLCTSFADQLKKIKITETNNAPYYLITGEGVFTPFDEEYLISLRKYVEQKGFNKKSTTELGFVLNALSWVTKQWKHDGMNQPPSDFRGLDILKNVHNKKERYRCVEYGIVLAELLQSYGFITRTVGLRTPNVAYGGFGQGHVAMEVWINELNKWVFLDPQFGTYLTKKNASLPLNYYEVFIEKSTGKWDDLEVNFAADSGLLDKISKPAQKMHYKSFLKEYFGFVGTSSGKGTPKVSLLLEALELPLTFQGGQNNDMIYTKKAETLYPELNKTSIILEYKANESMFMETIKGLNIKTEEDYLKNMYKFAAVPQFLVKLKTNSPLHKQYEYRLSSTGSWKKVDGDKVDWDATKASSYFEARSINKFDRKGPSTFIKMSYN